eukprot:3941061-Rhodomonas_salina.1
MEGALIHLVVVQSPPTPLVPIHSGLAKIEGGFVILWEGLDSSGTGVRAIQLNSLFSPVGVEFLVNTEESREQRGLMSSVASLPGGGFVIAWASHCQDCSGWVSIGGGCFVITWESHNEDSCEGGTICAQIFNSSQIR